MIHPKPSREPDTMTGRSTDAEQRVGLGIDFHRFVAGRPLVLGGVIIPFEKGLLGHSDADVLLHAISDALLGAASLGDIGQHFPDSDSRFKDADSARLLLSVVDMLEAHGWAIGNVDAVVVAEEPKLAGYVSSIRSRIAQILKIPVDRVGIKATTSETMGALGRREGMAAQCVVLIRRSPR